MSVIKQPIEQIDPPGAAPVSTAVPDKHNLPTMYDLPSEDPEEPGLPDEFHLWQPELCSATFRPPAYPAEQVFVASDLNLYYDVRHTRWYKRPDWFAVVGVSRLYEQRELRLSYVIWQEEVSPCVVIELLSPGTEDEDMGQRPQRGPQPSKWQVYEQLLAIPYYILFNRYTDELQVFRLIEGCYQPQPVEDGKVWLPDLQLGIGLWQGRYHGVDRLWLRWYDQSGQWIPSDLELARERAEQEQQRAELEQQRAEEAREQAEQERQRAEQEKLRADRLAEQLRALGIDPDTL